MGRCKDCIYDTIDPESEPCWSCKFVDNSGTNFISKTENTAHIGPWTTVRACIDCGVLVTGGPTKCMYCAERVTESSDKKHDIAWALKQLRAGNIVTCKGSTAIYRLQVDDKGLEYIEKDSKTGWECKELLTIDFVLSNNWRVITYKEYKDRKMSRLGKTERRSDE